MRTGSERDEKVSRYKRVRTGFVGDDLRLLGGLGRHVRWHPKSGQSCINAYGPYSPAFLFGGIVKCDIAEVIW